MSLLGFERLDFCNFQKSTKDVLNVQETLHVIHDSTIDWYYTFLCRERSGHK